MSVAVCFPLGDTMTGAILAFSSACFFPVFDELGEPGGLFELDLIEQDWPINDNNRNRGSMT